MAEVELMISKRRQADNSCSIFYDIARTQLEYDHRSIAGLGRAKSMVLPEFNFSNGGVRHLRMSKMIVTDDRHNRV